jgi:hypothetical protein
MLTDTADPLPVDLVDAIQSGEVATMKRLPAAHRGQNRARIGDSAWPRSVPHVVTDWPGHIPDVAGTVRLLVAADADVNARFAGNHTETPLHGAAGSDDVDARDALLDAAADIDALEPPSRAGLCWQIHRPSGSGGPRGGWSSAGKHIARPAISTPPSRHQPAMT